MYYEVLESRVGHVKPVTLTELDDPLFICSADSDQIFREHDLSRNRIRLSGRPNHPPQQKSLL